jgi:pSer/pThr/pTyr-binding forkhead associated (FHA) protein
VPVLIRIGRESTNDVIVPDHFTQVSRHHAEIHVGDDGSWTLVDLGSHNGTFVNGQRINQPTKINPAWEIRLGSFGLDPTVLQRIAGVGTSAAPTDGAAVSNGPPPGGHANYIRCTCGYVRPQGTSCPTCGQQTQEFGG